MGPTLPTCAAHKVVGYLGYWGRTGGCGKRRQVGIVIGALGEIRTPDPQIRSLMLYPAELRALAVPDGAAGGTAGDGPTVSAWTL